MRMCCCSGVVRFLRSPTLLVGRPTSGPLNMRLRQQVAACLLGQPAGSACCAPRVRRQQPLPSSYPSHLLVQTQCTTPSRPETQARAPRLPFFSTGRANSRWTNAEEPGMAMQAPWSMPVFRSTGMRCRTPTLMQPFRNADMGAVF